MLNIAVAAGTTDIVATPHANSEFPYDVARVTNTFQELSDKSAGLINLHLGCDFHLNYKNLQDAVLFPDKYTINHHQYLMVELPELVPLFTTRDALRQLIQAGIIPVITHPERNASLQSNLHELHSWVAIGCLVQVTAQSLFGDFGPAAKRASHSLLDANSAHFLASDAHDCTHRTPDLSKCFNYISSRYGPLRAEELFLSNPAAVLCGRRVFRSQKNPKEIAKLFRFWK